ncbi:DNA glycosylase [Irpex rosettiformis]|uniref:DNA glycosylase n=1 Tax=Irpex rosettiformis TaxID=378272 RepID=A0ACB8U7A0_9APHY|nr:DNA glycosylase [Irpex rosettiformis]
MPRTAKRPRSPPQDRDSPTKSKKLKLLAEHSLASPFPDFRRPTATEAFQVHAVLSKSHPDIPATPRPASEDSDAARTCGNVPNVLESLIGTILSQNTSSSNSTAAKRSLDETFGRNNFAAIVGAEKDAVVEAIRMGGLANKKAEVIQRILREVKERHGVYSLQHLAGVVKQEQGLDVDEVKKEDTYEASSGEKKVHSDVEAMQELVSYNGVGPKTASCVLLFCLGRESFPVDTHVFRLSKLLGWVPSKADRVTAQAHLDLRIPNELKYGLHVLMVGHGRRCKGCRGKGECPLKTWMKTRTEIDDPGLERIESKVEDEAKLEESLEAAIKSE